MTHQAPAASGPDDEVLEALDDLVAVLHESTRRNQTETRRAQTVRRLRSHGRSYHEILARVAGSVKLRIERENTESLIAASDRLHRAEARALHDEGVPAAEIAALCGKTPAWVSAVLADGEDPEYPPARTQA